MRRPDQFAFPFLHPPGPGKDGAEPPPPVDDDQGPPPESVAPYRPTAEDEQEATRLLHGDAARHVPPRTRADRAGERARGLAAIRAIRAMLDRKSSDLVESPEETIRRLTQPPPPPKKRRP